MFIKLIDATNLKHEYNVWKKQSSKALTNWKYELKTNHKDKI